MKAAMLIVFLLPSLLGALWEDAWRHFDGPFWDNFEVDILGAKVFGGRDCVVEVTSLKGDLAELHVTKGRSSWTTKCMATGLDLKEGEVYTATTTATDIDCKSIDAKSAPYVDLSVFFTPDNKKHSVNGVEAKCCCVGGRAQNVCKIVPTQGYLAKWVQVRKQFLFQAWNPLSEVYVNTFFPLWLFKAKNGCGRLVGKGYHSHVRGQKSAWGWKGAKLPSTKCQAKRSIMSLQLLPSSSDAPKQSKEQQQEAVKQKSKKWIEQVATEQPARWYEKVIEYADRKSFAKIADAWLKGLPDEADKKRISSAGDMAMDHYVLDSSGESLSSSEDPGTLAEARFPVKLKVRFLTRAAAPEEEEEEEEEL